MVGQEAMGVGSYKWKPAWPNVPFDNFCGEYVNKHVNTYGKSDVPVEKYDVRKWNILKDVDAEVSSAVDAVRALDPSMEAELAERFMMLQDRHYLKEIVSSLVNRKNEEIRLREEKVKDIVDRSSEETLKEIEDFEKSLGVDGLAEKYNGVVVSIEPYKGSWRGWIGGISVKFSDGRVLIKKGVMVRLFESGDDSWR